MTFEPQSWTWAKECTFPSDMGTAHHLIGEVMEKVRSDRWNEKDLFAIELVLEEAFANAVHHGNASDPKKNVRFECKLNLHKVWVRIEDEGAGFDPYTVADPTEPANQMVASGRGVLLIKHFVSRVEWSGRGNIIEFEKER
jgi:serine/threonine-protein kinase RsbW